ncbi:FAD-dependent monooxygenase [Fodinicola acaciae]|uniref:FAD-dependent monooxygenase n=1 Tax=Fodinicola acaciae TaxID=2681555 RepID=UPI0013D0DF98|nr:FAD-dependent monooxygenase [Fodinicola acaciae]
MIDVIVVGGGPTGFLLAGELKVAGAEPLVLEAATDARERRSRSFGMRGVNGRSVQTLALRGLDAPLAAAQRAMFASMTAERGTDPADVVDSLLKMLGEGRARGHFSGLPLVTEPSDLPVFLVRQHNLEQLLADWAESLGVPVWSGCEVVDVVDEGETVAAVLADGRTVRGSYLVGCDGGRSVVRKCAGIDFVGTDATMTGRTAAATVADPSALRSSVRSPGGLVNLSMVPGEIATIEFDGGPDDRHAPLTALEMQESIRRASGVPDVVVTSFDGGIRYSDNTRQATSYRRGRIFLAGDAAHVHSPIGGQGLNLGLQDAANLGWKLGLVVRGLADSSLLDTYDAERHPVGAWVLRNTRAQVALMRPGPQVDALREVVAEVLAFPDVLDHFVAMANGLEIDYAPSDPSQVGRFWPYGRHAGGVLIGASAAGYDDRIEVTAGPLPDGVTGLLVRPDGYVAWSSTTGDDQGLAEALQRWFGRPSAVAAARL